MPCHARAPVPVLHVATTAAALDETSCLAIPGSRSRLTRPNAAHASLQRTCARSQPCCQVSHTMADLKNCPTCISKQDTILSLQERYVRMQRPAGSSTALHAACQWRRPRRCCVCLNPKTQGSAHQLLVQRHRPQDAGRLGKHRQRCTRLACHQLRRDDRRCTCAEIALSWMTQATTSRWSGISNSHCRRCCRLWMPRRAFQK